MLEITITQGGEETFDEATNKFVTPEATVIAVVELEHSLLSVSKWEAMYGKPFISSSDLTPAEIFDYLKCMVETPGMDPDVLVHCTEEQLKAINEYINSGRSATTFRQLPQRRGPKETVTSELIYYWMNAFKIPFEAQGWHLNRLLALIKIHSVKNSRPPKRSPAEIMAERAAENERRLKQYETTG